MEAKNAYIFLHKAVIDSECAPIGTVTDILGPWLEDPSYLEVTLTKSSAMRSNFSSRIFFPIDQFSLQGDHIKLFRSLDQVIANDDYDPLTVMIKERYLITSVIYESTH